MGSSITANINSWSFRNRADALLYQRYPAYRWTFVNASASGWATWPWLVKLQGSVLDYNPQTVVIDTANSDGSDMDNATIEALVRRIWTACPNAKILMYNFFAVADPNVNANVNTPTDLANVQATNAVAAAYSIPLLDYWGRIKQRVNNEGHNLIEYMADTVHPTETGHNEAYNLLAPYLPYGGGSMPFPLPTRIYDMNGLYENTPTVILGTSYTSRTGTGWVDNGTSTSTSTAGDTITYAATCQSIGVYRATGSNANLEISVDGGAYRDATLYQNGIPLVEGRGAHTITIRIKAGGNLRVDEFWSI